MRSSLLSLLLLGLTSAAPLAKRASFAPPSGQTYLNIGQNYLDEWSSFASAVKTPAGISVYGDIYSGSLNSDSVTLLSSYAQSHSGNVEVGMSWKDAMTDEGYTIYQGAMLCHDIASGKYDSQLNKLASYLGQYSNVRYLLRVGYEVSGNLFANTDPNGFDPSTFDTTAYPEAFAHVRSVMSSSLSNIEFVYHPVRGEASLLYPGDDVVDWQGISIFNNDVCLPVGSTTNCEGSELDPNVIADINFATKPLIVAESAVQPPAASNPDDFITYLTRVKAMVEKYNFSAWTYINSNWPVHGWSTDTWGDSRIETNPPVLSWFESNVVQDSRYLFG